jgi:hypothetical protein
LEDFQERNFEKGSVFSLDSEFSNDGKINKKDKSISLPEKKHASFAAKVKEHRQN